MALPSNLGIWLDGLVAILLLVTVIYCLVLNRRLTNLRGLQAEMRQLLSQFTLATRQAEASVGELKVAGDQVGGTLERRIKDARALADELTSITQSANNIANRIENGLVGGGGGTSASPQGTGTGAGAGAGAVAGARAGLARHQGPSKNISESERELTEILRQAR